MDYAGLSLPEALNTEQFAQLTQGLTTYGLQVELLDPQGEVVLPQPPTPLPCCRAVALDSDIASGCQQNRRALCAAVLQEGQARTAQCPGHGTLVALPIRPFSTTLGVLMACQPPPSVCPASDLNGHAPLPLFTAPDGAALITLLSTLLHQSITVTVR